MKNRSIGFIGGGRVTKIMLHAFANKHMEFESITVCDTNAEVLEELKNEFPAIEVCNDPRKSAYREIVFIALHPPAIIETMKQATNSIGKNTIVISLAPKISIDKLSAVLNSDNIIRMIPNATSFINKGYNPVCFAPEFPEHEKSDILRILRKMGYTFETDEEKLESYAIISAMLPTYFWFQWDEMEKIGVKMGLDSKETKDAIRETLLAATQLFYNPDLTHEEVMDLIPVKPVAEFEQSIRDCFNSKLLPLFEKIKPEPTAV
jgi:pyrroline-5-carboxylate reductase